MGGVSTIGLDLAKTVFQAHGADAEAICEAAQRPTMRFVAPMSAEAQGAAVVFRTRDLLVRQRTQLINALRCHLAEFGPAPPAREPIPFPGRR